MSDWPAAGDAVRARIADLGLTNADVARRAKVAPMTLRELMQGTDRRRSPRTLAAVSTAIGWPPERLAELAGVDAAPSDVGALRVEVAELRDRVARLERSLRTSVDQ